MDCKGNCEVPYSYHVVGDCKGDSEVSWLLDKVVDNPLEFLP